MAIYGNGITASTITGGLGALWTHEVVLVNIPSGTCLPGGPITPPTGYPSGSLWYFTDPGSGLKNVYVI